MSASRRTTPSDMTHIALFAVLLELWCGNLGIAPGLTIFNAIYFAGCYGGNPGAAAALCSGLLLDGIYGRPFPVMTTLSLFCSGAAALLLRRENRQLPYVVLCGGATGFITSLTQFICVWVWRSSVPGPDWLTIFTFHTIFGAFYLPLLTLLLDFFAAKCDLPGLLSDDSRHRFQHRKRNL